MLSSIQNMFRPNNIDKKKLLTSISGDQPREQENKGQMIHCCTCFCDETDESSLIDYGLYSIVGPYFMSVTVIIQSCIADLRHMMDCTSWTNSAGILLDQLMYGCLYEYIAHPSIILCHHSVELRYSFNSSVYYLTQIN